MSKPYYICLSDNDDDLLLPTKSSDQNGLEKKMPIRPVSVALKSLGLSLIKLQYTDNTKYSMSDIKSENGSKSDNTNLWQSAWHDENKSISNYQFRQMLESRFDRAYKCVLCRSGFCQNQAKMTRLNWIHHARRGHVRVNFLWKRMLKKNSSNIGGVLDVYCVVCSKTKRSVPMSPADFVQHMKKYHPQFTPYNEYLSFFQRCFICNDQTRSFQQNVSHRQLCLAALLKDPNQVGTENFNNCFKTQRFMSTLSFEPSFNKRTNFDCKLSLKKDLKITSLYFWLQLIKNGTSNLFLSSQNGHSQKPTPINPRLVALKKALFSNNFHRYYKSEVLGRVAPGSQIDGTKLEKFFFPVPFMIKNEPQSKNTYVKWRKSIKEEYMHVQSNMPSYCEICNAMLRNSRSAFCHMKMCHPTTTFHEMNCKSCNKRFLTNQGYKKHYNGMKKCPLARRCIICNQCTSISDIYEHIFLKHKGELETIFQLQSCLICRNDVDDIKGHLFTIHGISNILHGQTGVGKINYKNGTFFNCSKCSLTYFSEVELRNHMILNNHHYECDLCPGLKFYLSWELMHHLSSSHKTDAVFICDLCDASGSSVTFSTSKEQIDHFVERHLSPCHVSLTDMGKSQ